MSLRVVRNHIIDSFLHCRRKCQLQLAGWQPLDDNDNLLIGLAVHAGLAVWSLKRDALSAFKAALEVLGEDPERQELVDRTYLLLEGYFAKYADDPFELSSPETEIEVPLPNGVKYGMRIDGVGTFRDLFWIKEIKTSGLTPGRFWRLYEMDRQTIGYCWGAEQALGIPIQGVMIDVLFKPDNRRPEPSYERRFIPVDAVKREDWLQETMQICDDMDVAQKEGRWYKSRACWARYNSECEYFDYCTSTTDHAVDALKVTHFQGVGEECF